MKNNFDDTTRFMFLDNNYWTCWACGQNHSNCLHHIFGRGRVEGCEKSVFNCAPLANHECHLPRHGHWTTMAGQRFLLTKTIEFLESIDYRLKPIDNDFLEKYKNIIYKLELKL